MDVSVRGEVFGVVCGKDKVRVVIAATREGKRFCIIE